MAEQPLSTNELHELLEEQFSFLIESCHSFDKGNTKEAKRLATTIRLLVHQTRNSHSLLGQLGLQTTFYESSENAPEIQNTVYSSWAQVSLAGRLSDNKIHFYGPNFGRRKPERMVDFNTWWDRRVIVDKEGAEFSRKRIVLSMADQDGGAHVDPKLSEDYYKLTRLNSVQDYYTTIKATPGLSPS
ncbi:hypothetical protein [Spirosoma areae]